MVDLGTVIAAGAAFYTGAKVAVINQPRRPELSGVFSGTIT